MSTKKKLPAATGTKKPEKSFAEIAQRALKAQQLVAAHGTALGDRITPAFLTALNADVAALTSHLPEVINTRNESVRSTAAQDQALLVGRNLVSGAHAAVRGMTSDREVRLAYGVGTKVPLLVKNVKASLQKIVDRATANPAEAVGFGITPTDITSFTASIAAIVAADTAQESARAAAPGATKTRNATARSVLAGIMRIAGAGMRAFANDPTIRAEFAALK